MHFRWRYVSVPFRNAWKLRIGRELGWEMTEEDARNYEVANPGAKLEPVENSGYVRASLGNTGEVRNT